MSLASVSTGFPVGLIAGVQYNSPDGMSKGQLCMLQTGFI